MHFIVENEAFSRVLALTKGSVVRSSIPILSHVAVEAADGRVIVRATNLDREVEAEAPAEVITAGAAALPGEVLTALSKKLSKGGQCQLEMVEDRAKITSGSSKYDLRTLPAEDFPSRKEFVDGGAATFSLSCGSLREMLQSVSYAADAKSPHLYGKGVHLHIQGSRLIAVATDHHRLALRSMPFPTGAASMPGVVVPIEAVRAICDLLTDADGEVEICVSPALIEVRLPGVRLTSLLIEAKYPDYERVIPKRNGTAATFRPYALAEAVDRAAIVFLGAADVSKRAPSIKVSTENGTINLIAGAASNEQATENVEAETNGHDVSFSVTATYLAEMLKVWPEDVDVGLQQAGPGRPVLFSNEDDPTTAHVIMPVTF